MRQTATILLPMLLLWFVLLSLKMCFICTSHNKDAVLLQKACHAWHKDTKTWGRHDFLELINEEDSLAFIVTYWVRKLQWKDFTETGLKLVKTPPSPEGNSHVCVSSPLSSHHPPLSNRGKAEQLWPVADPHPAALSCPALCSLCSSVSTVIPGGGEIPTTEFWSKQFWWEWFLQRHERNISCWHCEI